MLSTELALFTFGIGTVWLSLQLREEVYRLAALIAGLVAVAWGLSWASESIKLLLILLSILTYRFWIPLK
ncbi:MAG: hypothetical protein ACFBSC_21985 [Microcoleaceae cyanobacterium]